MSLTPSDLMAARLRPDQGVNLLENEILAEKASSLGHHGRKVEQAMAALRAHDNAISPGGDRAALLRAAAREVWAFFVQRELCGLRDQKDVIRHYGIPPEVLARLGAVEK